MHRHFRNCNEAFRELVYTFMDSQKEPVGRVARPAPITSAPSRDGDVLTLEEPITVTYDKPTERVLFNRARDCNPFFHLFESLWMLAGRNDLAPIVYYNSGMERFSDDGGKTQPGAYGYRWRHAYPGEDTSESIDQLQVIADRLRKEPTCRRIVLQMWNVTDDLLKIETSKDVCCNTHAYFRLRKVGTREEEGIEQGDRAVTVERPQYALDMTVCNRSNDLVWGMLGANVVHFSFLQEYMAAKIGVEVGVYHQVTNNLHVYTGRWKPIDYCEDNTPDVYEGAKPRLVRLVKDPERFDAQCADFVECFHGERLEANSLDTPPGYPASRRQYDEPFLQHVARPMCLAFAAHKRRDYAAALTMLRDVDADDWRQTGTDWIQKRKTGYEKKVRDEKVQGTVGQDSTG